MLMRGNESAQGGIYWNRNCFLSGKRCRKWKEKAGMANITIDGVTKEYPDGLKYEVIATEYQQQYDNMIALVLENGKIRELIKPGT